MSRPSGNSAAPTSALRTPRGFPSQGDRPMRATLCLAPLRRTLLGLLTSALVTLVALLGCALAVVLPPLQVARAAGPTVQFSAPSATVYATAGSFTLTVTLSAAS